ncbi:MAG: SH3 domain-containing protein [Anaerolineales bacterium]
MKYVAIGNHIPEATGVLHAIRGDELNYERRETIYEGWIWCTDRNGTQAWVPEAFVRIEGNRCYLIRDYVSQEMAIEVGDVLDVIEIESKWAWASNKEGEFGWVPMDCLERCMPAADNPQ